MAAMHNEIYEGQSIDCRGHYGRAAHCPRCHGLYCHQCIAVHRAIPHKRTKHGLVPIKSVADALRDGRAYN